MLFERWLYTVPLRLRTLFRRDRVEDELDEELRLHVERLTEEHVARGLSPADARYAALRAMHGIEQRKEECRDTRGVRLIEDLVQDVRYAVRVLRRSPAFTAVAVITLTVGIGANTAIFSLADAVLRRPLPVTEPQRLVLVEASRPSEARGGSFSYPHFAYIREHARGVDLFAYARIDLNLSARTVTDAPSGQQVSDNFFSAVGALPALGRPFVPGDEAVAVISDRFWKSRFGGDRSIVGSTALLNGLPFTIVGVTPPTFFGVEVGRWPDVYVPIAMVDRLDPARPRLSTPNSLWLDVMGRLGPGVGIDRARVELDALYQQGISEDALGLPDDSPLFRFLRLHHISVYPGGRGVSALRQEFGKPLLILMTVVGLVLLVACANVAGLLMARAAARQREVALRLALGASRLRLLRQFVTESLVLSAAGGAAGLVLSVWASAALVRFLDGRVLDVPADATVLAFMLAVSAVAGLLFGVLPAVQATRPELTSGLKTDAQSTPGPRRELGRILVAGQVAVSLSLVICAGLFIRTLTNLRTQAIGAHSDHVLVVSIDPSLSRYTPERTRAFYDTLLARVGTLPGVRSTSLADMPLLGGAYMDGLVVEHQTSATGASEGSSIKQVSPGFFDTMGITLRIGRDFLPGDREGAQRVAIVNDTIARTFFPGRSPIGARIGVSTRTPDLEIVGVIADTKYRHLRDPVPNTVYLPIDQARFPPPARTLHVRTTGDPRDMIAAVRAEVRALDSTLPVTRAGAFSDLVDENVARERLVATLAGCFGALALLLMSIGLYGVLAYSVQQRTREIGIRMSLGAPRGVVTWMIVRHGLSAVLAGVVMSVPLSVWASKLVSSQLFGVRSDDPATFAAATILLVAVAGLAGYLPARRAARVDPIVALRQE